MGTLPSPPPAPVSYNKNNIYIKDVSSIKAMHYDVLILEVCLEVGDDHYVMGVHSATIDTEKVYNDLLELIK